MEQFEIIVPTLFGLETFTAKEVRRLGYETTSVEDGRVTFLGDWAAVCRANMWIRTGERVLIKAAEFKALSFEELFDKTYEVDWERWIGKSYEFPVKGYSLKSKLASVPDCQSIIKGAIAKKLSSVYGVERMPEDGALSRVQFSILKDRVTIMVDTSGEGLHKRGYRQNSNLAPLRETIAASMVMMSYWKWEYPFCDPFCGSGTIPIEAAMFKRNIAPGLTRRFAAQQFQQIEDSLRADARDEARSLERELPLEIYAYDIDKSTVELAAENARIAGVGEWVKPAVGDAARLYIDKPYGTIICNPPYGERLSDKPECEELYRKIGKSFKALPDWSYYVLTSHEGFESLFGQKADKKRKLYNGMIRCNVYQYFGKRPPKINR